MRRNEVMLQVPGVLGYVDGTEISISCPYTEFNPQAFWTHKHHYALNCQIVCDADLKILNVNAAFPGSCNDSYIWAVTALRRRMIDAYRDRPCWLLGDSGYPLELWLMTPIVDAPPGSDEETYTSFHCSARNCVERTIGVLKSRFRCLLRENVLHYQPLMAGKIVMACCLLHNICRNAQLVNPPVLPDGPQGGLMEDNEEDEDQIFEIDGPQNNLRQIGLVNRERLVNFLAMRNDNLV